MIRSQATRGAATAIRRFHSVHEPLVAALLLSLAAWVGCSRSEPAAVTPAEEPVAEVTADIEPIAEAEEETAERPEAEGSGESTLEPEPAPQADPERFMLMTPDGPFLVAVEVYIDGQPQRLLVDRLLDAAFGHLGEGSRRWSNLMASEAFASGELGNPALARGREGQQMIERYDANRNGQVEREEMAALLAADNAYGKHFSVVPTAQPQGDEPGPTFKLVDQDENGRLTADEISAGAARLLSRDANDDSMVTAGELRQRLPSMAPPRMEQDNVDTRPDKAFELTRFRMNSIYYALCDLYELGDGLDKACFGLAPHLLAECDANGNGRLEQREAAGLLNAASDLRVRINLGQRSDRDPIELVSLHDEAVAAGAQIRLAPQHLSVQFPRFGVRFQVADQPIGEKYRALQVELRAGENNDPLFSWLDINHDGRLAHQELVAASERLKELMPPGADNVVPADLPRGLTCLVRRGPGLRDGMDMTYPVLAPQQSDGPKWMTAMDTNQDGVVSPREFLGTIKQFEQLDANRDGTIDATEAQAANGH